MEEQGLMENLQQCSPKATPFVAIRNYRERRQYLTVKASQSLTEKAKPDWTGDALLSRLVNAAISFKPLYSVMKVMAKQTMQNSAERNGIPWRKRVKDLYNTPEVFHIKDEIEDKSIAYPEYYLKPFHAYERGNLDWLAAFENESASSAMAWRVFKDPAMSAAEAERRMRGSIFGHLESYSEEHGALAVERVLDVGCSVGVSSRLFAQRYPHAQVTGLDLSPHFLAVAEHRERQEDVSKRKRIQYVHALAEETSMSAGSFDIVSVCFVIHECPPQATAGIIKEAVRLLRPGGRLLIEDNNPASKTIQNLPPVLFTLMKSTEPWSDEYYAMDVEEAMRQAGLQHVVTRETDHRHRAVLGTKA